MSENSQRKATSLEEVAIRNLGVIESAEIEFSPGFTVLTGETGAGKTMVLTALGMVLGAKADSDFVRSGAERAVVSARFEIGESIRDFVLDQGGEIEGNELLLSRSISAEGKSRINIGGVLSTATKVGEISDLLIEIHGQSTNLRLIKPAVQREMLDSYVKSEKELKEYQGNLARYQGISERIESLRVQSAKKESQIASLKEFIADFSKVLPTSGEIASIEDEINRLGSVEELNNGVTQALNFLDGEDAGVMNSLQSARKSLESLKEKDSALDRLIDKYSTLVFDLTDLSSDLLSYMNKLEANPTRFDALQQRKASINSLIKKYGEGSDRIAAFENMIIHFESAKEAIKDLDGGDARISELEIERATIFKELKKSAEGLSRKRRSGAEKLALLVSGELQNLSMPNSQLICEISSLDGEDVENYSSHGIDEVHLLFAGHVGATPLPLSKVASGGETSRVMLALSVVIAESSPIGTYIFDEVDAGVGGAAAVEVGRRLKLLSKSAQVIVVTHLAQVAVWADTHLVVRKDQFGSVTSSDVHALTEEERRVEIARMLSGQSESVTAQEHAGELLDLVRNSSLAS